MKKTKYYLAVIITFLHLCAVNGQDLCDSLVLAVDTEGIGEICSNSLITLDFIVISQEDGYSIVDGSIDWQISTTIGSTINNNTNGMSGDYTSGTHSEDTNISDRISFKYTIEDEDSNQIDCISEEVNIIVKPIPDLSLIPDDACPGSGIILDGKPSGGSWTFNPPTTIGSSITGNTLTAGLPASNGYSEGLKYDLDNDCENGMETTNIMIPTQEVATIGGTSDPEDIEECSGNGMITLVGNEANESDPTYAWTISPDNAGFSENDDTATLSTSTPGNFTVTYSYTANGCNSTTVTQNIKITKTPSISEEPTTGCQDAGGTITINANDATMYTITMAGMQPISNDNGNFTGLEDGIYTISVSNGNCSANWPTQVVVNCTCDQDYDISLPDDFSTCISGGAGVMITATLDGDDTGDILWSGGTSSSFSTTTQSSITYTPTDMEIGNTVALYVSLLPEDDDPICGAKKDTISITFKALPNVMIEPSSQAICKGEEVTLTASGANTYQWNNGGGTNEEIVTTLIELGDTTFTVMGTTNGCTSMVNTTITVNELPPNGISEGNHACVGSEVSFSATGGYDYSWTSEPANAIVGEKNKQSVTLAFETLDDVSLNLLIEDQDTGCENQGSKTILVCDGISSVSTMNDTSLCFGTMAPSLQLSATVNYFRGDSSENAGIWSLSNADEGEIVDNVFTPTQESIGKEVILVFSPNKVMQDGACDMICDQEDDPKTIKVKINNGLAKVEAGGQLAICVGADSDKLGGLIELGDGTGGSGMWEISSGSGELINPTDIQNAIYRSSVNDQGNVTLRLVPTGIFCGVSFFEEKEIIINPLPSFMPVISENSGDFDDDFEVCTGDKVQLNVQNLEQGDYEYEWKGNVSFFNNNQNPEYTVIENGATSFELKVRNILTECENTEEVINTLKINRSPVTGFDLVTNNQGTIFNDNFQIIDNNSELYNEFRSDIFMFSVSEERLKFINDNDSTKFNDDIILQFLPQSEQTLPEDLTIRYEIIDQKGCVSVPEEKTYTFRLNTDCGFSTDIDTRRFCIVDEFQLNIEYNPSQMAMMSGADLETVDFFLLDNSAEEVDFSIIQMTDNDFNPRFSISQSGKFDLKAIVKEGVGGGCIDVERNVLTGLEVVEDLQVEKIEIIGGPCNVIEDLDVLIKFKNLVIEDEFELVFRIDSDQGKIKRRFSDSIESISFTDIFDPSLILPSNTDLKLELLSITNTSLECKSRDINLSDEISLEDCGCVNQLINTGDGETNISTSDLDAYNLTQSVCGDDIIDIMLPNLDSIIYPSANDRLFYMLSAKEILPESGVEIYEDISAFGNQYKLFFDSTELITYSQVSQDNFVGLGDELFLRIGVQRDNNCVIVSSSAQNITFYPRPELDITGDNLMEICANEYSRPLTAEATNFDSEYTIANSYDWQLNNVAVPDIRQQSNDTTSTAFLDLTSLNPGTVNVDVYSEFTFTNNDKCDNTETISLIINNEAAPDYKDIRWWPGNILASLADPDLVNYQWGLLEKDSLTDIAGENNQFFLAPLNDSDFNDDGTPNGEKVFYVKLTNKQDNGCVTTVYYDGISFKKREVAVTEQPSLVLIPNPTRESVMITADGFVMENITLYNPAGRVVRTYRMNEPTPSHQLNDLGTLDTGLYIVTTKLKDGRRISKKLIINQ